MISDSPTSSLYLRTGVCTNNDGAVESGAPVRQQATRQQLKTTLLISEHAAASAAPPEALVDCCSEAVADRSGSDGQVAGSATKGKRWPIAGPSVCLLANGYARSVAKLRLVAVGIVGLLAKLASPFVAKRKPASTVSGEQSDRQLSAGASRQTAP